jgi:hypothetical protein
MTVVLLTTTPAMADPSPTTNPNTSAFTLSCIRATETESFQTVTITQNLAVASQRLDGQGVVIFTHIEFDGQVFFDIPGQAGRSDVWTCTITEVPGVIVTVLLTPRS